MARLGFDGVLLWPHALANALRPRGAGSCLGMYSTTAHGGGGHVMEVK